MKHLERCIRCLCSKVKHIFKKLDELQKQIDKIKPSTYTGLNGLVARVVIQKGKDIHSGDYFIFDEFINEDDNKDIKVNQTDDGTEFILNTPGMYHFDWQIALNLAPKYDINIVLEVNGTQQKACSNSSNINQIACSDLVIVKDIPVIVKLIYAGLDPEIKLGDVTTQGSLTIIK